MNQKINSYFDVIAYASIRAIYFMFFPFPWAMKRLLQFFVCICVFLILPYNHASALMINIGGSKLEKVSIVYTEDKVVTQYVDFAIKEINNITDIKFKKQSIKSSINFIIIGKNQKDPSKTEIDKSEIKDDGFLLQINSGEIQIYAKEPLGLVYGLMEFLELLGFRYYMPGLYGTVYPDSDIFLKKIKIVSNPSFKYRGIGKGEWSLLAYRANVNIDKLPERYGRSIWGTSFHTFDLLLPKNKYLKDHSEYFAKPNLLLNIKKGKLQLNTSNPEVVELVAKKLYEISKQGKYEMLTLAPSDGRKFDLTPQSLSLDEIGVSGDQKYSRRMLIFYNKVARRYKELGGSLPIRIGAYDAYTAYPKDEKLSVESGLIPFIAHYDYCQLHRIENNTCKPNRRFSNYIYKWQEKAKNIYIYEYTYKRNWFELPWPVYINLFQNIKFYLNKGAIGYYSQFSETNVFSNLLNYYITGKALWDPDINEQKIYEDFFTLFYKGVSERMKLCYKLLENDFAKKSIHVSGSAKKYFFKIYSKQTLQKALKIADDAYQNVTDSKIKARIEMMIIWLKYSIDMWELLQGINIEKNSKEIIYLINLSENRNYPIFNKTKLVELLSRHKILELR